MASKATFLYVQCIMQTSLFRTWTRSRRSALEPRAQRFFPSDSTKPQVQKLVWMGSSRMVSFFFLFCSGSFWRLAWHFHLPDQPTNLTGKPISCRGGGWADLQEFGAEEAGALGEFYIVLRLIAAIVPIAFCPNSKPMSMYINLMPFSRLEVHCTWSLGICLQ